MSIILIINHVTLFLTTTWSRVTYRHIHGSSALSKKAFALFMFWTGFGGLGSLFWVSGSTPCFTIILYIMFYYCCSHQSEVDRLKEKVEEMKKQISNIYELLEVLTSESKSKNILEQFNNKDVQKTENDVKTKHTSFIDKTAV